MEVRKKCVNKNCIATKKSWQHVSNMLLSQQQHQQKMRERGKRERARVHFRNSNFKESFSCDMKNNIEFSCRLLLLLLQFYMQLKNSNKEEKPGKCWKAQPPPFLTPTPLPPDIDLDSGRCCCCCCCSSVDWVAKSCCYFWLPISNDYNGTPYFSVYSWFILEWCIF